MTEQYIMQLPSALSSFSPKKVCFETVSYIFSKEAFLIFRKWDFFIFFKKKISLYFGKGIFRTLVYPEPSHIQIQKHIEDPGIFRNRDIIRTLSNIYNGMFCKEQVPDALRKSFFIFLYFGKWNFLALVLRKPFLYSGIGRP